MLSRPNPLVLERQFDPDDRARLTISGVLDLAAEILGFPGHMRQEGDVIMTVALLRRPGCH